MRDEFLEVNVLPGASAQHLDYVGVRLGAEACENNLKPLNRLVGT
jgi:hypothetical protein